MALKGAATACYCPPPAFSLEMDLTEWMDTVEDFIFVSGVPPYNQATSARLLMTEAGRRELFSPGSSRDSSWQELKRRLLTAYGQSESLIRFKMRFSGSREVREQIGQPFHPQPGVQRTPLRALPAGAGDSHKGTPVGGKSN
ncbi:hypothetical protein T03_2210 [Trichinella britovi]|uniref:Uncharacterized protein n=1 Tax=Trichinella britovi TaxID=45882 RepID=A0A0V1CM78_TRIBR|nr:hypothetical protein T03_2210 [Trichinella britovi]